MELDALSALLPGFVCGVTTVVLGHPLDTLKTRLQAREIQRWGMQMAITIVREEGPSALYRGVVPPLVMTATKRSLQLTVWEFLQKNFSSNSFVAGAIAGGLGTVIGCPLHVVKIQTQNTQKAEIRNAFSCALAIAKQQGLNGFYRGFWQHALKDTCFAGCYLGIYGTIRDSESGIGAFGAGSIASCATWFILYPLDTFKTVAQAGANARPALARWWRGIGVALLRAGPVSGASMIAYEKTKALVCR